MASVKVAVRVRPFNKREVAMNAKLIVQMDGKRTRIYNSKSPGSCRDNDKEKYKDFTFDHSYWSYEPTDENYASQEEVFYDLGTDVIESAFAGYNACVFAYGQTGSGKTFTMMGSPESQGLIPRICKTLFARMAAGKDTGASYRTEVSFLEIHNERVRDLLRPDQTPSHSLKVREHPKRGPYVQNLSNHLVYDYSDIQECMVRGNTHRTTASTNMNDVSSRSHAIFTITFVQAGFSEGNMPSETVSKVHLVDLAGSERANATGATGQRLKEGAHINKSLVTLGSVISALADISSFTDTNSSRRNVFIPYRDSVLTWLLKDSLGGNSKTIMIAAISPADCNYGETLSTLRYANRAKNIINKPTINEDPNVKLIKELRDEIMKLKSMIGKDVNIERPPQQKVLLAQIHEKQEQEKVLTEEWTEKWRETQMILQEQRALGLRKSGVGVVLDSEMPHLVGIDDDLLSTGVTLYHLKEGKTLVGTEEASTLQDIVLTGADVEPEHCIVELDAGVATLHPLSPHCWINMAQVDKPTRLSQGCIILLGRNNMFRYNDPAEAAKLRKEGGTGNGNLQSTVVNLSRLSLLSWSVSDLNVSSSSDNLLNSNEDLRAFEELEQQKAALIKEKEDFKKEQEEREERWAARREALEGAQKELEREWGAQWREWADAIAALESRQRDLRTRRRALEQERRDEMTQVENLCREVSSLRTNLQTKLRQFEEFINNQNHLQKRQHSWKKTDDAVSNESMPESWSSFNDQNSLDAMKELVNHHKKELAALEFELQTKVKSLSERQTKVDKMEEELSEMTEKQRQMLYLEYEGQEITEKKVQLAKRTQDQLQEILKRKQSLTLNLKRALPASPGRSSSSSDVLSSHDLKSFQDACNRKLRIASALCLLPSDLPSSTDTTETFHTAAANSPELRSFFPEIDITEVKDIESNKIVEENKINKNEDSNEYKNQTAEKVQSTSLLPTISSNPADNNIQISPNTKLKEEKEGEEVIIEKINDKVLEKKINSNIDEKKDIFIKNDEIESQEVASIDMRIQENKEMKRLNEQINQQRMVVMKCLETSSPAKDDLNQQILVLQDFQRQQIELEVWLLKQEKRFQMPKGTSQTELPVNYGETESEDDGNWNLPSGSNQQESDRDTMSDRIDEQTTNQSITPRIPTTRGYSSVYLTSLNRGDRLGSPYALSITRSLPSLIPSDSTADNVINMIVTVPSYVIRGAGSSSHYEYEVRVVVQDDSWTLLRRYRRFRELCIYMRQKYNGKVSAIHFPPRQVFAKYEVVARQRRKRLEEYLRRLIQVCSELPTCESLYKFHGNLCNIDKQSLIEFSPFFRRGPFEGIKFDGS
ncbi:Similar to Klp98A: Kinesin-like protein Klp98A (Drosophila melanogaster) [Cotesia congregata]|uniref:Similar to Klp98A: Kinesin-like protein Klp98A (Drosophila melanogaster) n=1 Tax=Cotesia congregata TaxID=51543 RepID=A0A8J2MTU1_COTCN|nr:Similar to Klp98A: Kinesin-like protein Klp98A (Drosophila melanogaster) [Cotesia congregata]